MARSSSLNCLEASLVSGLIAGRREAIKDQREFRQMLATVRAGSKEFGPLPHTRDEVNAIAQVFTDDGRPSLVLVDTDASESKLNELATRGALAGYGVIHFAAHASVNDRVPDLSAVILTQTGLPDALEQVLNNQPPVDGRLSVREIQHGWELKADLVTLSACQTALGRFEGGEGFVGFTQALLISGVRSVCLSLWKVNDLATSLLMKRFYQNWLRKPAGQDKPISKAEALRDAKRWLRGLTTVQVTQELDQILRDGKQLKRKRADQPNAAHPFEHPNYWAGFILVGDAD